MRTIKKMLYLSTRYLDERNIYPARKTAEDIVAFVLKMSRVDLYLQFDRKVLHKEWHACLSYLKRKGGGEPIEHMIRNVEFFQCQIGVTPSVLIPRQETEILLWKACQYIKEEIPEDAVAWDLCTGSGCLGLGLKKAFPKFTVTLSDISPDCIDVAKRNAKKNRLDVFCLIGDLLDPFKDEKAHVILCNPPYLSIKEFENLHSGVKDFEPTTALLAGETGLEFFEKLSIILPEFLYSNGWVFLEIGALQKLDVERIFSDSKWKRIISDKDWSGKDRFIFLQKS